MEKLSLIQERMTIIGPKSEIDPLTIYLKNEIPSIDVIKSAPHFPLRDSLIDLYLVVCGEDLTEVVGKIRRELKSSSIYRGWIDFSQIFYPICLQHILYDQT
jgi:hypothetical protein